MAVNDQGCIDWITNPNLPHFLYPNSVIFLCALMVFQECHAETWAECNDMKIYPNNLVPPFSINS